MSGVFFILFPICFLVTAALQQAQLVEYIILPAMYNYFTKRDVPYVMAGVCFFWTYVVTASLSVWAQSAASPNGYNNNVRKWNVV